MQKDFLEFIKKHALIDNEDNVLLAVSGGVDSVVMAHLFNQSGISAGIAHCNFQLRGQESDEDEAFVSELAKSLDMQFHAKSFDTTDYANQEGISTQMAARNLRYGWFQTLCEQFGYTKIAVAHHRDDNIETVVHNLVRGTSISGLRGMKLQNDKVIRPLLAFSRGRIEASAKDNGIIWREDSSNDSDAYKRNFIRHQVIPKFSELNPNYAEVIDDSMRKNLEVEQIFKDRLAALKEELLVPESSGAYKISIQALKQFEVGPYVLSELLKEFGFNYSQCREITEKLEGHVGKQFPGNGFMLTIDRAYLCVDPNLVQKKEKQWIEPTTQQITGVHRLLFSKLDKDIPLDKTSLKAYLDFDKLKFPLKLRLWREGDSFIPLGMKGKKKLSDFMIDSKIPLNLKQQQEVILSGEDIVWVVGKRIDERYKVTESTEHIFLISQEKTDV